MDFAERLSLWLTAFDAIGLQSAHQAIQRIEGAAPPLARPAQGTGSLDEDLARVRSVLARAIGRDPVALLAGPQPAPDDLGYAPYQQRHLELQRQMEQMIAPLRDHVRQALCRLSPALRQLALLDAAFAQALAAREQLLLNRLPALLKRRFEQVRRTQAAAQDFGRLWREALLAELDLRLAPVAGLVDAARNPTPEHRA